MFSYILRRLFYAIPIVFGVILITFAIFFLVRSPHEIARQQLGPKASAQTMENWLHNRGLDKPRFLNLTPGASLFDSQLAHHVSSLLRFDLGESWSTGDPVLAMFKRGALPSLLITLPAFICGLLLAVSVSLFLVFARESTVDRGSIFLSVALMSIPYMTYMIVGQWLVALKLSYLPASGFHPAGLTTAKYLALPVLVAILAGVGADVRLYRAIFIEEIHQDYVRTAQAKGASNARVLFTHVLKNGMIALVTLLVASLPFLIMGSLLLESFFGIPGLGNMALNAIRSGDWAVVLADVYLGSLLYLFGLLLTDICYAAVDPRIRFR